MPLFKACLPVQVVKPIGAAMKLHFPRDSRIQLSLIQKSRWALGAVLVGLIERRVAREIDVFQAPGPFLAGGLVGSVLMGRSV